MFGWYIVAYLFLAGAGAGAFFAAACACVWDAVRRSDASEKLARTCQAGFYAAPCLMALAGMFHPLPRSTRRAVMARAAFLG